MRAAPTLGMRLYALLKSVACWLNPLHYATALNLPLALRHPHPVRCKEKGIDVKMVTGDQQLIGVETARQLGMGMNIFKIEKLLAVGFQRGLGVCGVQFGSCVYGGEGLTASPTHQAASGCPFILQPPFKPSPPIHPATPLPPLNPDRHSAAQAKAGSGLVDGIASVDELVEHADGFAEVFPEHKFEIVDILQVGGAVR